MTLALPGLTSFTRPISGLEASVRVEGGGAVVALRGESDVGTLQILLDVLSRAIAEHEGPVVIDLAETQFIDTASVRALDRARQLLDGRDRQLTFRAPSRLSAQVLASFGLSHLVERDGTAKP